MNENIVDIFNKFFSSKMENVHTCIPGKIVTFSGYSERKAKVKPLVKFKSNDNTDVELPEIDNVPVIFPCTANFNMLYPLKKDDGVLLLFAENGIGKYLNSDMSNPVNADDENRFTLTDCIAIPGLWSFTKSKTFGKSAEDNNFYLNFGDNYIKIDTSNNIKIQNQAGKKIELTPTQIGMNGATESFIKGDTLYTLLNTYFTTVSTITPGTTAQNAGALGAIKGAAVAILAQLNNIKSTTIKGE